jgi:exopolyphosphatase/guanosine-5'-triphosphate,3'-diphosphate pyrophosphatase
MAELGIVDLGSNTARLVVFEYEPESWFRLTSQIREPIRLGEGVGRDRQLTEPAMQRAAAVLKLFADYRRSTEIEDFTVIATSAVRDATNRDRFLQQIEPLGLDFELLSGEAEAQLSVLPVANNLTLENAWVIDLGGGSAQISRMRDRQFAAGESFPLGALRLTEGFLNSDPPSAKQIVALEKEVAQHLGKIAEMMRRPRVPLVAMGGTIRNLARVAQKRVGYPFDFLHGFYLSRGALEGVVDELLGKKTAKRARIPGIKPDRADIVLAGALVYRWLLCETRLPGLTISGYGLREGYFFRRFLPPPHLLPDVRRFGVENLLHHYPQPAPHLRRVRRLASNLFDGLEPLHRLDVEAAQLLDDAAALHDIGMAIGYHRHHRHGAYLLSTTALPGFTHRQQALLTLLVQHHRGGMPDPTAFEPLIQGGDKRLVLQLAACLRIAEQCERSRSQRIEKLEVKIGERAVTITAVASDPPQIELSEAAKQGHLFERAFGRTLELDHRS